jgi:hypothetical protein
VKRKFRVPGQTFAESISALISFIEANPMVRASTLPAKFLGIEDRPPGKPAAVSAAPEASAAPVPTEPAAPEGGAPADATSAAAEAAPAPEAPASAAEPVLTIEQRAKISRMQGDLRWLVTEGYVTEFIDGRLFAPPPMVEARKKEVEAQEHDPENFPEPPASNPPFEGAPAGEPSSAPATESAAAEPAPIPATQQPPEMPAAETSIPETTNSTPTATVSESSPPGSAEMASDSPPPAEPEAIFAHVPAEPEIKTEAATPPAQPAS